MLEFGPAAASAAAKIFLILFEFRLVFAAAAAALALDDADLDAEPFLVFAASSCETKAATVTDDEEDDEAVGATSSTNCLRETSNFPLFACFAAGLVTCAMDCVTTEVVGMTVSVFFAVDAEMVGSSDGATRLEVTTVDGVVAVVVIVEDNGPSDVGTMETDGVEDTAKRCGGITETLGSEIYFR